MRELKVRLASIEKQKDSLEKNIDYRFTASDQKIDAQFKAVLAAISESKAQSDFANLRHITHS